MSDKTLKSMATTEAANVAGVDTAGEVCPKCGKERLPGCSHNYSDCQIQQLKNQLATITRERDVLARALKNSCRFISRCHKNVCCPMQNPETDCITDYYNDADICIKCVAAGYIAEAEIESEKNNA